MERVQAGDAAAFRVLFDRHRARVHGFLVRRTGSRERGAELFQETFLRVWRARATWRRGRPFRPWLFGIAVHAAQDEARRGRRRVAEVELDEARHATHDAPDARIHLEEAIAGLPDTLRDAFLLGVVEGFDHNEVAEQLGITPANARARISRARRRLRDRLRGER